MSRLSMFTTKTGRMFTCTCVGLTGLSLFGVPLIMHGPMQDKLQKLCQFYDHGKPKPLSNAVNSLVKEVVKDCPLSEEKKKNLKFFNTIGLELFNGGGMDSPWGALIGIPFNFEDPSTINYSDLHLAGHEDVDWIIEGNDLLDALTLSDKAKKFGLMREIYSSNIWDVIDNAILASFSFLLPAALIKKLNIKNNMVIKQKFGTRIQIYLMAYMCGYAFYRMLKDPMSHISGKNSDLKAATCGPEYLVGGIEFYEKTLARNKTLRSLLGYRGKKLYREDGSENWLILAPKLPTKKRLELLQNMKMELQAVPV